jgi:hypothetical protein
MALLSCSNVDSNATDEDSYDINEETTDASLFEQFIILGTNYFGRQSQLTDIKL